MKAMIYESMGIRLDLTRDLQCILTLPTLILHHIRLVNIICTFWVATTTNALKT